METAIELVNLTKKFGDFTAVNNVSLKIEKGEIFGLLGPNGAGKSTTINMLLGLIPPTSGKIIVEGKDLYKNLNEIKQDIGLVMQETIVEPELTAEQNLILFAKLYHVPNNEIPEKIDSLLELAGLSNFKKAYAGTFSGGMKRRLEMVKSLIQDPKILVLDEPTTGLDIQNRTKIWELIRKINVERKVTVLMTTQYLEEANDMCNRIAIMDKGRIIALGTPTQLKHLIGKESIIEIAAERHRLEQIAGIVQKETGEKPNISGDKVSVSVSGNYVKIMKDLLDRLNENKIPIEGISMHEPTLDDVFLKLTGTSLRDTLSEETQSSRTLMMRRR